MKTDPKTTAPDARPPTAWRENKSPAPADKAEAPKEIGGRDGPDPTRFGDWEVNGICVDF